MAHALADGVDARIEGLHRVVHDDAAVAVQARGLGERDVGPDADRHHDELGGERLAVLEADARDAPGLAGDERLGLRLAGGTRGPWLRASSAAGRAAVRSSWRSISHGMRCTTVTSMPRSVEPVRRLEPEQPAADHDRVRDARRRRRSSLGVGDVAVGEHARQVVARESAG